MFAALVIFLWLICISAALIATLTGQWIAAIFWWGVVVWTFTWHFGGYRRFKCLFGWHEWSMERGYYGAPHHTAVCKNCGTKPKEYNA